MYREDPVSADAAQKGIWRTFVVSILGLLPACVVSAMMLLRFLGVTAY